MTSADVPFPQGRGAFFRRWLREHPKNEFKYTVFTSKYSSASQLLRGAPLSYSILLTVTLSFHHNFLYLPFLVLQYLHNCPTLSAFTSHFGCISFTMSFIGLRPWPWPTIPSFSLHIAVSLSHYT
jgi:hypothetical protein